MTVLEYILSLTLWQLVYHTIICYYLVQLARVLYYNVYDIIKELIPINDLVKKYSQPDSQSGECWAVITGATDGIGLGFAQVLTQLGFDICLISRNQQKLNKTVEDLKKYRKQKDMNRKIMAIQFNYLDSTNQQKFKQMIQKVKKLDIGILVNNVGTSELKQFQNLTYQQIVKIINVNVSSTSLMTSELLKHLKARKAKSAIINLSSFGGQSTLPYATLYSATKAMNTFFTEALSLQNRELDILSVRPMFVESPLSRQKQGPLTPNRRQCAWGCLKELRWEYETNGYYRHRIMAKWHQLFIPRFLHLYVTKWAAYVMIGDWQQGPRNKQ